MLCSTSERYQKTGETKNKAWINIVHKICVSLTLMKITDSKYESPKINTSNKITGKINKTIVQVGTKSKIRYNMNGREIEMIETITKKELPERYDFTFEAKGMYNEIENHFIETESEKTKWISHNMFEAKGFLKLLTILMPGSFKKQSFKYMVDFKNFAEKATD